MPSPALPRAALLVMTISALACGGSGGGGPVEPPPTTTTTATVIAGGSQTATANSASDTMRVRFTKGGAPVANASVSWTTTAGTLLGSTSSTDASGVAQNVLTSVGAAGTVNVTASASGASASFTVTVTALPPGSIRKVGNDPANTALGAADSIRVQVVDADAAPKAGVVVTFAATAGGGSVSPASVTTDAQGHAATQWTRGTTPGANTATATAAGYTGSPIAFSVTTIAPPPGTLEKVGGDPTETAAGAADTIRVRALDDAGAPRAGVTVTFAVTAGGGSVSPSSVVTDANGVAAARWTRGGAGTNTATASVPGMTGSPVTFTVNAVAVASSLHFPAAVAVLDAGGDTAIAATVRDGAGAGMPGHAVTYVSRSPSVATVSEDGTITGVARGQAIIVASAEANGTTFMDSLLAVVAVPGGPVVITDLADFEADGDTTLTVSVFVDMRTASDKVGSGKIRITWDPALLSYESNAEGAQTLGAEVNTTAAASGSMLLAFANANGFSGKLEVRRITFRTAAAGGIGALTVEAQELFAADSYTSLLPQTVSVTHPLRTR